MFSNPHRLSVFRLPGSHLQQGFEPNHLINAAESPTQLLRKFIQTSVAVAVPSATVAEPPLTLPDVKPWFDGQTFWHPRPSFRALYQPILRHLKPTNAYPTSVTSIPETVVFICTQNPFPSDIIPLLLPSPQTPAAPPFRRSRRMLSRPQLTSTVMTANPDFAPVRTICDILHYSLHLTVTRCLASSSKGAWIHYLLTHRCPRGPDPIDRHFR